MTNLNDFGTLAHGTGEHKLTELLDVSAKTIKRWTTGETNAPKPIMVLLRFINYGQLDAIGGKDWEGFAINVKTKRLQIPAFHKDCAPEELKGMFFEIQAARHAQREILTIRQEQKETQAENEKLKIENAFFRTQLKQANREFLITHSHEP